MVLLPVLLPSLSRTRPPPPLPLHTHTHTHTHTRKDASRMFLLRKKRIVMKVHACISKIVNNCLVRNDHTFPCLSVSLYICFIMQKRRSEFICPFQELNIKYRISNKQPDIYVQLSLSRLRLSRITAYLEDLVLVLTQKLKIRLQNIVEKRRNCSWGRLAAVVFVSLLHISCIFAFFFSSASLIQVCVCG